MAASSSSQSSSTMSAARSGHGPCSFGTHQVRPALRVCAPQRAVSQISSGVGSTTSADGDRQSAVQAAPRPPAHTSIRDAVPLPLHPHPRPGVWDTAADPDDGHDGQARRFQRKEQHAVSAGAIDRVEPDVRLQEAPEIRKRKCGANFGASHDKRDEADVGHAVGEHVGAGARRVHAFDAFRPHRPMDEGQVSPALVEGNRAGKRRWSDRIPREGRVLTGFGGRRVRWCGHLTIVACEVACGLNGLRAAGDPPPRLLELPGGKMLDLG